MKMRPIRNDADLEAATDEIASLWGSAPGSEDADRLEVLVILVDAYERAHHPVLPPNPIEAIRFELDQRGLTARDLEPFVGSRTRVYEVLTGRRPLTLRMIRNLSRGLGIPAGVLVGTEPVGPARPVETRPRRGRVTRAVRRPQVGYSPVRRDGEPHPVRYGTTRAGDG
jgi:HTH-type transcriptional regulator/antitoxin HigA